MIGIMLEEVDMDSEDTRAELRRKGERFYEENLRERLEPAHNNECVAIHVDSGEYALAPTIAKAVRALVSRTGIDGRVLTRRVGNEPSSLLASRLIAASGRSFTPK